MKFHSLRTTLVLSLALVSSQNMKGMGYLKAGASTLLGFPWTVGSSGAAVFAGARGFEHSQNVKSETVCDEFPTKTFLLDLCKSTGGAYALDCLGAIAMHTAFPASLSLYVGKTLLLHTASYLIGDKVRCYQSYRAIREYQEIHGNQHGQEEGYSTLTSEKNLKGFTSNTKSYIGRIKDLFRFSSPGLRNAGFSALALATVLIYYGSKVTPN